jgi:hypothetical protein
VLDKSEQAVMILSASIIKTLKLLEPIPPHIPNIGCVKDIQQWGIQNASLQRRGSLSSKETKFLIHEKGVNKT